MGFSKMLRPVIPVDSPASTKSSELLRKIRFLFHQLERKKYSLKSQCDLPSNRVCPGGCIPAAVNNLTFLLCPEENASSSVVAEFFTFFSILEGKLVSEQPSLGGKKGVWPHIA